MLVAIAASPPLPHAVHVRRLRRISSAGCCLSSLGQLTFAPPPPSPLLLPAVSPQLVSRRLRDLADLVLEEAFKQRWGVAAVVAAPPAAPMYASARHAAFVLCHQLVGRGDTLASLAVRHGTDVVELKRLNNLTTDGALASRCGLQRLSLL